MKDIVVYSVHEDEWPCKFCDKAKALLKAKGLAFEERQLYADERAKFYVEHFIVPVDRAMPQIFIDDVRIGGYDALSAMADRGEL